MRRPILHRLVNCDVATHVTKMRLAIFNSLATISKEYQKRSHSKIYVLHFWSKREREESRLDLGHIFQKFEIISSRNKKIHIFVLIIIRYDKLNYSWRKLLSIQRKLALIYRSFFCQAGLSYNFSRKPITLDTCLNFANKSKTSSCCVLMFSSKNLWKKLRVRLSCIHVIFTRFSELWFCFGTEMY